MMPRRQVLLKKHYRMLCVEEVKLTEREARQILSVTEQSLWEEIAKKYDNLFERNATNGSFYLQSKVHRAKECLESVYEKNQPGDPSVEFDFHRPKGF